MNGKLYRWNWAKDCTQSVMQFDGLYLHTIERPYVRADHPGGKPFESCIEPGKYDLVPFTRPSGDKVYQLLNPELGVYEFEDDLPEPGEGRFLILIHAGNWAKDVVGCIAPGLTETVDGANNPMVGNSKTAMQKLMSMLDSHANNTLEIVP